MTIKVNENKLFRLYCHNKMAECSINTLAFLSCYLSGNMEREDLQLGGGLQKQIQTNKHAKLGCFRSNVQYIMANRNLSWARQFLPMLFAIQNNLFFVTNTVALAEIAEVSQILTKSQDKKKILLIANFCNLVLEF